MKTFLFRILIITCFIAGCDDKKKSQPSNKDTVESNRAKTGLQIDYASNEMEDLGTSQNMEDIISQNWEFYEDAKDAGYAEPSSNIELVYRGYSLFSDGTVIKNPRGNIQAGKWKLDESQKPVTVLFDLDNGEKESHMLAYLMPYEMKLAKFESGQKKIIDLRAAGIRYKNCKDDPFYFSNNLWRFKPTAPESDEQIKNRVQQCIHFFIMFYDHQIKADTKEVLFTGLPSCFKWYGGGIYLQKPQELQDKWINTFYNREQALKAYRFADKLMSNKFTWPKKESNWLKLNVAVLRQMEEKMKSL